MRHLVIHGHFYQPPRENPWTGLIAEQAEATPWSDWNARICSESYEANAFSPLLDAEGRICRFVNNYEYLSYNIGPTLLDWLEQNAPHVYEKILEADARSLKRLGEGNAMAQGYNHMIIPLADAYDKAVQIHWGLEDFKGRFGRDSKGLWLPETAICPETAEELVKQGVRYTILSPFQMDSFNGEASSEGMRPPWQKPWQLDCPSGKLTVFFYHPGFSSEISFNHILRDADSLYDRLNGEYEATGSNLLGIATDGEIYGHHEKLGNMGLTALIDKIEKNEETSICNFSLLERLLEPAGVLSFKKEDSASSWSCTHGVSRWQKNCGCSTGGQEGWNQNWRRPLRKAFDALSAAAQRAYIREVKQYSPDDPYTLLTDYIEVLLKRTTAVEFLKRHALPSLTDKEKESFFKLLEGQKFRMFSFTSCGWFFADISGREPRQNMMYAARLLQLYGPWLHDFDETDLLQILKKAESNLPGEGNGAEQYRHTRERSREELYREAATGAVRNYYSIQSPLRGILKYTINNEELSRELLSRKGRIRTGNDRWSDEFEFSYRIEAHKRLFSSVILNIGEHKREYRPEDLDRRAKDELLLQLSLMETSAPHAPGASYSALADQLDEWLILGTEEEKKSLSSATALYHTALRKTTRLMEAGDWKSWKTFLRLINGNERWKLPLPEELSQWLKAIIKRELTEQHSIDANLKGHGEDHLLNRVITLLRCTAADRDIIRDATLSGRIYDILGKKGKEILTSSPRETVEELKALLNIAEEMQFQAE